MQNGRKSIIKGETIILLFFDSLCYFHNSPVSYTHLKRLISRLVDEMENDKVGMIVFAGDAFTQLPITSDYISAKMFLESINPSLISKQGTAIGAAINRCV